MREILFRGKLTDDSKWVYGCLIDKIYGAVPAIMSEKSVDDAFNLEFEYDHVQEKTVGQYTGMKDKNGKQIFEGDIVIYDNTPYNAYGHRVTGVIVWHKWAWKCRYKEYVTTYHYAIGTEDFFGAKSEVIGNHSSRLNRFVLAYHWLPPNQ